ncbi:hypothetical protein KCP78_20820 [Salmonella enterica subsp. enterica]|nr:hypothetical protein KCP78_20820 [Salmonella enterica subsp. enterica]
MLHQAAKLLYRLTTVTSSLGNGNITAPSSPRQPISRCIPPELVSANASAFPAVQRASAARLPATTIRHTR